MLEVPTTPLQTGKSKITLSTKKVPVSPRSKKYPMNPEILPSTHRKPWSRGEQELFEQGLAKFGRSWTRIATMIDSRTVLQVKNYANQYFKNKDKVLLQTKTSTINGKSPTSGLESSTKAFPATSHSNAHTILTMDTKSQVATGPLVHIEQTSDEEEIEVDIDGDSEDETMPYNNNESTDNVYETLLKSVSDSEDFPNDVKAESSEDKIDCSQDQNKEVVLETTDKTLISEQNENDKSYINNIDRKSTDLNEMTIQENSLKCEYRKIKRSVAQINECINILRNEDANESSHAETKLIKKESFLKPESQCQTDVEKNKESKGEKITSYLSKEQGNLLSIWPQSSDSCSSESRQNVSVQSRTTVGEVTSNIPTSIEEKTPNIEGIKEDLDLAFEKDIIHDLEKEYNKEFFMGRSLKTPQRYIKIRNHILEMWEKTKPNYLYKTSVRPGLRNCGDVNSIGRVHAFLEEIGAINIGCSEKPRPRPRQLFEAEKIEDIPTMESWTNFLRPRKRRARNGDGDWVDESQSEGLTIAHFPCDEDEDPRHAQEKVSFKKSKVPRSKSSFNPFLLVPCRTFPTASAMPFEVIFQSDALVVVDVHSHLSTTEVIGLLGGTYSSIERVLKIICAAPCKSLSTGMQCEMDPVSQTQAAEELSSKGLSVVGWYHSHPTFSPSPSLRDIETQGKFQEWFGKGGSPFIGVIASPYNYTNTSNQSQITTLTVSDEWESAGQYRLPYQFEYKIQDNITDWINVVNCIDDLEVQYQRYKYRMPLTRQYSSSSFTALDKLVESLRPRLRGSEEEKQDFISELRNIFTSDIDSWSSERGQENVTRNTEYLQTITNDNDLTKS